MVSEYAFGKMMAYSSENYDTDCLQMNPALEILSLVTAGFVACFGMLLEAVF